MEKEKSPKKLEITEDQLKLHISKLGITGDEYEKIVDKSKKFLEDLGLGDYSEIDTKLPKEKLLEACHGVETYMSGERTPEEAYSFLLERYRDAGINIQQARKRVLGILVLATILPYELLYFLEREKKTNQYRV